MDVKATTAALTINGNDHSDTINVGSLAPGLGGTLTGILGVINVVNTSASSTLNLDDSGDATGRNGTISTTSVTGFGLGSLVFAVALRGGFTVAFLSFAIVLGIAGFMAPTLFRRDKLLRL